MRPIPAALLLLLPLLPPLPHAARANVGRAGPESDRSVVFLLGAAEQNGQKRGLAQALLPALPQHDYGQFSFVLYQSAASEARDGLEGVRSEFLLRVPLPSGPTLILATKAAEQMSLEELQLLGELLYRVNDGLVLVDWGPEEVLTHTLLAQSAFCWARGQLRPQLVQRQPRQVLLCNGARPSSLSILAQQPVQPLHAHPAELALPTLPQHRLWPSMLVSAAEPPERRARSKHTDQPSARKDRVYGKDRPAGARAKHSDDVIAGSETARTAQQAPTDRLQCKYRKSCYEGSEPPPEPSRAPLQSPAGPSKQPAPEDRADSKLKCKYRTSCYTHAEGAQTVREPEPEVTKSEKSAKPTPPRSSKRPNAEKSTEQATESRQSNTDGAKRSKEECKYRKSCYETGVLDEQSLRPPRQPQTSSAKSSATTDKAALTDDDHDIEPRLRCKYRKSCYESGELDLERSRAPPAAPAAQRTPTAETVDVENLAQAELKHKCKYRRSCYETGQLRTEQPGSTRPAARPADTKPDKVDVKSLSESDKKLACKYRSSCYSSGRIPEPTSGIRSVHSPRRPDHPAADDEHKPTLGQTKELQCKYRKSCYETGQLPTESPHKAHVHVTEKAEASRSTSTSAADPKLSCKYRKSCYEAEGASTVQLPPESDGEESDADDDDDEAEDQQRSEQVQEDEDAEEADDTNEDQETVDDKPQEVDGENAGDDDEDNADDDQPDDAGPEEIIVQESVKAQKTRRSHRYEKETVPKEAEPAKSAEKAAKKEAEAVQTEEKPGKKDVERRRKNPENRFVSKFKKVGNYETLPKEAGEEPDNEPADAEEEPTEEETEQEEQTKQAEEQEEEEEQAAEGTDVGQQDDDDRDEDEEEEEVQVVQKADAEQLEAEAAVPRPADPLSCKYRRSCYRTGQIDAEAALKTTRRTSEARAPKPDEHRPLSEADKKLACKYRHSCYGGASPAESRKAATQVHTTSRAAPEVVPVAELKEDEKKLRCKYRRSCYESGVVKPTPEHSPKARPTDAQVLPADVSDADRRLKCKYRRSCYEDGQPRPAAPGAAPPPPTQRVVDAEPESGLDQKLACKYRKSCYSAADERPDAGGSRPEQQQLQSGPGPAEEEQGRARPTVASKPKKGARKAAEPERKADDVAEVPEGGRTAEEEPAARANLSLDLASLPTAARLECKYRHSCYSGAARQADPERLMRLRGEKCSKYKLSCRQKLGLPPKERAPVGPDGRKLCRKRPKEAGDA